MSHITELSRTLIGRGLVQSLSGSSLRTQGPITPGLTSEKGLCSSAEARVRAVWVPAFAGTTCWKIPYAISPSRTRDERLRFRYPAFGRIASGVSGCASGWALAKAGSAIAASKVRFTVGQRARSICWVIATVT